MVLGLGVLLAACAPSTGWQRTDRRACAPQSPPILCLAAQPEAPHELHVGGRVVLPGECIEAPSGGRGGSVRASLSTSGEPVTSRWLRVRKGAQTEVRVEDERLRIEERRACDDSVPSP